MRTKHRIRRTLATVGAVALLGAGVAVTTAPGAGAGAPPLVPTTTADDGSEGSLRNILENVVTEGATVELEPGATYQLTRCLIAGQDVGATAVGHGDVEIAASVQILGNGATIEQTCLGSRVLFTDYSLSLNDVTITGGTSGGGGGGVRLNSNGTNLTLLNTSIVGNCSTGSGGGIKMNADGNVQIWYSTIANNVADDSGGGLSHSHVGDVLLVNSTVSGNAASFAGGVDVRNGTLATVYADVVDNEVIEGTSCGLGSFESEIEGEEDEAARPAVNGDPANLYAVDFAAFGSVVALPVGGHSCVTGNPTASSGYNFADDTSCGFTDPTDTEGEGLDPMLGALAANGGPTLTHLPQTGSPLIDAVPNAECNGGEALAGAPLVDDQRALARPSPEGGACDIGSVEVQVVPAAVIEPTFTG